MCRLSVCPSEDGHKPSAHQPNTTGVVASVPVGATDVRRGLLIASLVETGSLLVLLGNLLTAHLAGLASMVGPIHGTAYLVAIALTFVSTRQSRPRLFALVPGIGGLLANRDLARLRRPTSNTRHSTPARLDPARIRAAATAAALLATGLLAGAFGYGRANVVPAFDAVPLDVHLPFRVELMKWNAPTMQPLMVVAVFSSIAMTLTLGGRARLLAAAAAALDVVAALITRFGNVPINLQIKQWVAHDAVPPEYLLRLQSWDFYDNLRVAAALAAFVLVVVATQLRPPTARRNEPDLHGTPAGAAREQAPSNSPP